MGDDKQSVKEPGLVLDDDFSVDADVVDAQPVPPNERRRPSPVEQHSKSDAPRPRPEQVKSYSFEDDSMSVEENTGTDIAPAHTAVGLRGGNKQRIGDRLVDMGVITEDQLNVALQEKKISGKMIGEVLVDLGFIDAETLSGFLAQSTGVDIFDPKTTILDSEALSLIEKPLAVKHSILPVSKTKDELLVAMADPYDVVALDILRKHIPRGLKVKPIVGTPKVLADAIDAAYGHASTVNAILKELEGKDPDALEDIVGLSEDEAYSHPLVRLVNALIFEAVKVGASDLHFEPEENFVRLRYRKDGVLSTVQILHKQHWNGISQRIKLMANLNIADKLAPQDGRIRMNVGGHEVDFRVSSLPTVHGENIVMRVLDKQSSIMPLIKLGFSPENKKRIARAQKRPEGIIIVTGPTGSGKTTSLYSMLNEINTVDVNIQTLEDPVEYSLPMIRQTPVREGILEFADGIRALLRQDPDIIFIGEIRDKLTAEMALQAAMTGHQVYTTLHTNDSFGALPRLFDLGMVPGMVAGNIIAVFAQRLARTLCPNCKEPHKATEEEVKMLGVSETPEIFKARQGGCQACEGQGYKGRTALAEILLFDEIMDEIVARAGTKAEIKEAATSKGFKSMREDAMLKILEGITTFEAVSKVVDISVD
jgi:general secretion pathway protein E/type IV pilus assembly protein PilB